MNKIRPFSLFSYLSLNGTHHVQVNPDPPSPLEAKPFHVAIYSDSWIPVSVLVFARDEQHARARVHQALQLCLKKNPKSFRAEHGQKFLAALQGGDDAELTVEVTPLDTRLICASVNWASNGGLL